MNPDVKMDLEFILERNLDEIITKFANYVDCLRVIIEKKEVSPREFYSYLMSLMASSKTSKGQKLALLSHKETELKQQSTIIDIFDFLKTRCASFLNYDVFQKIMEKYQIKEDQDDLKYHDHLKAYIYKHKISESDSEKLILKYDVETTCRLANVFELKKVLARILNLNPSTLHLYDIKMAV